MLAVILLRIALRVRAFRAVRAARRPVAARAATGLALRPCVACGGQRCQFCGFAGWL